MADFNRLVNRIMGRQNKVSNDSWLAFQSFPMKKNTVDCFSEYLGEHRRFALHFCRNYFNGDWEEELAFNHYHGILREKGFDFRNYFVACREAENGGLRGLFSIQTEKIIEHQTSLAVDIILDDEIGNRMDATEIIDLMEQYVSIIGRHWNFKLRSVESLAMNYRQVIHQYINILRMAKGHAGHL